MTKRLFLIILPLFIVFSAHALSPINKSFWSGLAIKGYDPVAYFTLKTPTEGKKEFSFDWNGAIWRFANEEHRTLFQRSPEKYAPQYGGYCAYAVSQNSTAGIDPEQWTVVEDKLYLNYNKDINEKWAANRDQFIKDADSLWPKLLEKK